MKIKILENCYIPSIGMWYKGETVDVSENVGETLLKNNMAVLEEAKLEKKEEVKEEKKEETKALKFNKKINDK